MISCSSSTCGVTRSRNGMRLGTLLKVFCNRHSLFGITQNFSWISDYDAIRGHVLSDNAAGSDNGVFTNCGVGEDRGARAD